MIKSTYYGRLNVQSIPSEVKKIWYSRDEELPELPVDDSTREITDDLELVERKELANRIMADAPLTKREELVVQLRVVHELTFEEIGQSMCVTRERIRQIYDKAMRKLRTHQAKITGNSSYFYGEMMTWGQWRQAKQREAERQAKAKLVLVEAPEPPDPPLSDEPPAYASKVPQVWVALFRRIA